VTRQEANRYPLVSLANQEAHSENLEGATGSVRFEFVPPSLCTRASDHSGTSETMGSTDPAHQ
jgi:hypothetical protein